MRITNNLSMNWLRFCGFPSVPNAQLNGRFFSLPLSFAIAIFQCASETINTVQCNDFVDLSAITWLVKYSLNDQNHSFQVVECKQSNEAMKEISEPNERNKMKC